MNKNTSDQSQSSLFQRLTDLFSNAPKDRRQLMNTLQLYENSDLLDYDVLKMVEGALQVSEMQVRDIMIPHVQMVVVKNDSNPDVILTALVESGHSRFPVIGNDNNNIIGIFIAKDLLKYFSDPENNVFDIKDMMRPAFHVPESKRLNVLLREFRANRNHMAIVVDEYSSVAGLVTMEDVIEKIVGKIEDEHDVEDEEHIQPYGQDRYTVNALTPISEFNDFFDTQIKEDECDTIGGITLQQFGYMPGCGENIEFKGFDIKIVQADKRRIQLMRVTRISQKSHSSDDSPLPE